MEKDFHNVAVIPGDLHGKTVTESTIMLSGKLEDVLNKPIRHTFFDYSADYFSKNNITELGEKELNELKKFDQIFMGAIGDETKLKPGVAEIGIILKLRQAFDQYVNLRPIILPEGVPSVLKNKDYQDINFEICRENSEGLYVQEGRVKYEGTEDEVGIQVMRCSYKGVKRLAEFALDRAIARKKFDKPRLHFVFKNNVLTFAAVPWTRVQKEFIEKYKDVDIGYMHVDSFTMQMITKPEQFDVVVIENMFGDITTDLGAVLQGGIESGVSGNINPTGEYPSMFEPIHGTAPDKWYKRNQIGGYIPGTKVASGYRTIRSEAAFLAYAMMLEQMGELKASNLLKEAAHENLRNPDYKKMHHVDLVNNAVKYITDTIKAK